MTLPNNGNERLKDLLLQALEMDAAGRAEYLTSLRADDAALCAQLENLIGAWDNAATMLREETPAVAPPGEPIKREAAGDRIGPYVLEEKLGEGGFGVVFRARQEQPVRREIAIKILKAGMDSWAFLKRFELERQALALLNHASIARIYDAGQTPSGRPYFAMEYVGGLPITEYCDAKKLDLKERLRLFREVCDAVQHAHQKGVIHRDLKPSNVLVTDEGGKAQAKIIDFGIAKAVDEPLTDVSVLTKGAQILGTPQYMSPEQASLDSSGVDTRSDVYSLGVILYELLCGQTPLTEDAMKGMGIDVLLRTIREGRYQRPSARLESLHDDGARVAANRSTELWKLQQALRRDLDWIAMTAINPDPSRRYPSAAALGNDVRRSQENEPVTARPPTTWYQVRTFARRNRALVGGVAASILLLIAGVVGTGIGLARAIDSRDLARRETNRAQSEALKATQVSEFLMDMLRGIEPEVARGRDTTVLRSILDQTSRRISVELAEQPEVRANLHQVLGVAYMEIGEFDEAADHLTRAIQMYTEIFGSESETVASAENDLALVHQQRGEYDESLRLMTHARAVALTVMDPTSRSRLAIEGNYAGALLLLGRMEEAEPILRDVVERERDALGPADPATFSEVNRLANLLERMGRQDESETLYLELLAASRDAHGTDHPSTIGALNNLSVVYLNQRRIADAAPLVEELVVAANHVYGPTHPTTLSSKSNLATLRDQQGDALAAERLYREVLNATIEVFGERNPNSAHVMNNLASVLTDLERFDEALDLYTQALDIRLEHYGPTHMDTLTVRNNIAVLNRDRGRYEESAVQFEEAVNGFREALGPAHPSTLVVQSNLGDIYTKMGRYEEAERLQREVMEGFAKTIPPTHYFTSLALQRHGAALVGLGRYTEAEDELTRAFEGIHGTFGDNNDRTRIVMREMITLYETWHAAESSAGHDADANEWRERLASSATPPPPAGQ
jgi:serine/threonine protein kinase/tetratricopeptide (TPR) repeat protein